MRTIAYFIALSCGAVAAHGQQAQLPAPQPMRCTGAEHRALDFMVGQWRVVHTATGALLGQNHVEWINLGCAIRENLVFPGRGEGASIYFYSTIDQRWHGNYHDSAGQFTSFEGTIADGRLTVEGKIRFPTEPAREWRARQTTFRAASGWPRQIGERWHEDKKTWEVFFDVSFCPLMLTGNEKPPCR